MKTIEIRTVIPEMETYVYEDGALRMVGTLEGCIHTRIDTFLAGLNSRGIEYEVIQTTDELDKVVRGAKTRRAR
jgi:hypothetical protein